MHGTGQAEEKTFTLPLFLQREETAAQIVALMQAKFMAGGPGLKLRHRTGWTIRPDSDGSENPGAPCLASETWVSATSLTSGR